MVKKAAIFLSVPTYLTVPVFLAITLFFAACSTSQKKDTHLRVGAVAPEFQALDQNGQTVILAELYKDGPLLLTFLRSFY